MTDTTTVVRVNLGSNYLPFYRYSTPYHRALADVIEAIPIEERRRAYRSLIHVRRDSNNNNNCNNAYKDMRETIERKFKEATGVKLHVSDEGAVKDLDVIELVEGACANIMFESEQERTAFLLSTE